MLTDAGKTISPGDPRCSQPWSEACHQRDRVFYLPRQNRDLTQKTSRSSSPACRIHLNAVHSSTISPSSFPIVACRPAQLADALESKIQGPACKDELRGATRLP